MTYLAHPSSYPEVTDYIFSTGGVVREVFSFLGVIENWLM
jgi:hypothetical protein